MNILLLSTSDARVHLTLCVSEGVIRRALDAHVAPLGSITEVIIREESGHEVHREEFGAGETVEGLKAVLDWIATRGMRVDFAVHRVQREGDDAIMRLSAARAQLLALRPSIAMALQHLSVVEAWKPGCPQFAFHTFRPHSAESLVSVITGAAVRPPESCTKGARVRCENCEA